jgi:hypothetical protein
LWWDKVALGQVFSEFFGFPCNRRSLQQLLHNHPHVSSGEWTIGQCGRSAGIYRDLGDLKKRDLRNLNLGDLKKGPNGGVSPTQQKKTMKGVLSQLLSPLFGAKCSSNELCNCLAMLTYVFTLSDAALRDSTRYSFIVSKQPDLFRCKRWYQYLTYNFIKADHSGRAVKGMNCFRSLERWNRGFESHSRHGCLYCVRLFRVFWCCVYRYRPCNGLIPRSRSPTDCV